MIRSIGAACSLSIVKSREIVGAGRCSGTRCYPTVHCEGRSFLSLPAGNIFLSESSVWFPFRSYMLYCETPPPCTATIFSKQLLRRHTSTGYWSLPRALVAIVPNICKASCFMIVMLSLRPFFRSTLDNGDWRYACPRLIGAFKPPAARDPSRAW
jgi:hypothetical protein